MVTCEVNEAVTTALRRKEAIMCITTSKVQCERWNKLHMVGAKVYYRTSSGKVIQAVTRARAIVNGRGEAVVWLDGVSGERALADVWPRSVGLFPTVPYLELITR